MASLSPYPWCAAKKCPATPQQGCLGYITDNSQNQTAQSFVACCQIQCGRSANEWLLALECGGSTTATAVGTIFYLLLLLVVGGYILALGPFLKLKNVTFWISTIGSLIFMTGTGVFVTNVTSPFMVLRSVPALGAMNVAVFSYFYSGFRYGVGLAYEGGPLVVFVTTSFTIWKTLVESTPDHGPIRTSNNLALVMLVLTFLWIVHSVSYRLYGYRVDWRLGHTRPNHHVERDQDPRFHLGAAQGHPTWRTPMGQSTSVVMTALAWWMVSVVKEDLVFQECRPDWVIQAMLYGAPCLISVTILWNVFGGIRCRTIEGQKYFEEVEKVQQVAHLEQVKKNRWNVFGFKFGSVEDLVVRFEDSVEKTTVECEVDSLHSDYPGYNTYKYFIASNFTSSCEDKYYVWTEYVQAAALQRMDRNSLSVEVVPKERLDFSDKVIGFLAWFLAQGGLVISIPGFFGLMLVAELLGRIFEAVGFRRLVVTDVRKKDRQSAVEVVEQCYVGANLGRAKMTWESMDLSVLGNGSEAIPGAQRSINLHTLLDNTGPCELYNLLTLPGLRNPAGLK